LLFLSLLAGGKHSYSQQRPARINSDFKNRIYFYYGWNVAWYSKSDITFEGSEYNFTIHDVKAKDRPSPFNAETYFKYNKFTTPQYNFRIGYFFNSHYEISIGADHMKYVMVQDQSVKISGEISNEKSIYQGSYNFDDIALTDDFLKFEHTDGLNYINIELRRMDNLFHYKKVDVNITEGAGTGVLYPRTNVTLMNFERNDEFHFSGYGFSMMAGLNVTFFDCIYFQTEIKGGYINMPDIVTTNSAADKASQHFFFGQYNFLFGGIIKLGKHKKPNAG